MFSTITPARPALLHIDGVRGRASAFAAALAVAAGGAAAIGFSSDDTAVPAEPNAAQQAPAFFGDAPVLKGARADNTNAVLPPVFGDPAIRKGAQGR